MRKKRKHSVPSRHEYLEYERRKKELWLKHDKLEAVYHQRIPEVLENRLAKLSPHEKKDYV